MFGSRKKLRKVDAECQKMREDAVNENKLSFLIDEHIETDDNGVPYEGELARLGIKAVDFKAPVATEFYISKNDEIRLCSGDRDDIAVYYNAGKRFILENLK